MAQRKGKMQISVKTVERKPAPLTAAGAAVRRIKGYERDRTHELDKRFPYGIAILMPIFDEIEPLIIPASADDKKKPRATSIPIRFEIQRGTNSLTGLPNVVSKTHMAVMYPGAVRTNALGGEIHQHMTNYEILEYILAQPKYGYDFKLVKIPEEILEREFKSLQNPEAARMVSESATSTGALNESPVNSETRTSRGGVPKLPALSRPPGSGFTDDDFSDGLDESDELYDPAAYEDEAVAEEVAG